MAKIAPADIFKEGPHSVRHSNRAELKIANATHSLLLYLPPWPATRTASHFASKREKMLLYTSAHSSLRVRMCMSMGAFMRIYAYMFTCGQSCTHICACTCACMYMCLCKYVCVLYMWLCIFVCVRIDVCVTGAEAAGPLRPNLGSYTTAPSVPYKLVIDGVLAVKETHRSRAHIKQKQKGVSDGNRSPKGAHDWILCVEVQNTKQHSLFLFYSS